MHLLIWLRAVVARHSFAPDVLYNMFPKVYLGKIPVCLEVFREIAIRYT